MKTNFNNRKRHETTWRAPQTRLPAKRKVAVCRPEAEKDHEQNREKSSDCTFCQENKVSDPC